MNSNLHKRLLSEVDKLKKLTAELNLHELTSFVTTQQRNFNHGRRGQNLGSPLKQGMYLLALASSQPEPIAPKPLDEGRHVQLIRRLESIFQNYGLAYFPTEQEYAVGLGAEWHRQREIAMPAFMHYFMAGFKASSEQIKEWINTCFTGFEKEAVEAFGMSHIDLLRVASFIESVIEANANPVVDAVQAIEALRQQFLREISEGANLQEVVARVRNQPELRAYIEVFERGSTMLFEVKRQQLLDEFGVETTNCLMQHFVTVRGAAAAITYITESNPIIDRPLLTADGERIFYLVNNAFYQAIIEKLESHLTQGPSAARYFKERDRRLEQMARKHLQKIFPDTAKFYESAFDRPDSHGEHDLVIVHGANVYIVEAKASPPKEPLRDPSKAALRIRDHFRGRNGIQKAYDQANALRARLLNSASSPLYDKKGNLLTELHRDQIENIYCICVTRDDFGPVATNLALMLEKDPDAPYPWVVCVTDLEYLVDAIVHLEQSVEMLDTYLAQRPLLHGKVMGTDELEYFGAFLRHGGLHDYIAAQADFIPMDITESDILDDIHKCIQNGEPYKLNVEPANLVPLDRRKVLGFNQTARRQSNAMKKEKKARQKQGRAARKQNRTR
ncbi:NERD domain-containing protein [Pseudomonas koreensis]|uniref:NERD domain-containing protein n=1 Tax=Pseudomonas koreensis TaxID=198620 RepID=A0A9X2XEE7_9PSED|nr:NERD domain-containing protein [Pseudomonas koreensis]MCU7247432.1 NERD domain-containing protein [Pseudomonas koreensis]